MLGDPGLFAVRRSGSRLEHRRSDSGGLAAIARAAAVALQAGRLGARGIDGLDGAAGTAVVRHLPSVAELAPRMIQQLSPVRIGPIALDFPVCQAALSGYSDWPMRVIARRLGAAYTLCELMLDQFILSVSKGRKFKRFLKTSPEEHPCGAQMMGSQPEDFSAAAGKLVAAGFDAIDINFGCPVKKVLGRCRGGYLLSTPAVALEIVARTRDAVPPQIPVTVKMRRGMDDSPESRARFFEIFDGAFARGAAAITVHGRTVRQRYEGPARGIFSAR